MVSAETTDSKSVDDAHAERKGHIERVTGGRRAGRRADGAGAGAVAAQGGRGWKAGGRGWKAIGKTT